MKSEVGEEGKENLGQERGNGFAVTTPSQPQPCALASCLVCRSQAKWVLLEVSIATEAQEVGWARPRGCLLVGYRQGQAEDTLPAFLALQCRRY